MCRTCQRGIEFLNVYNMPSIPRKRLHNNKNAAHVLNTPRDPFCTPFQPHQPTLFTPTMPVIQTDSFLDGFMPVEKKWCVVRNYTQEELAEIWHMSAEWWAHKQAQAKEQDAKHAKMQKNSQLNQALQGIWEAGFKTLHSFIDALISTDDPTCSSQVTQMIDSHGISMASGVSDKVWSQLFTISAPMICKTEEKNIDR